MYYWHILEYSGAYSQLAFAGKKENDPVQGDMQSAKLNLVKQLKMMSDNHPQQVCVYVFLSLCAVQNGSC